MAPFQKERPLCPKLLSRRMARLCHSHQPLVPLSKRVKRIILVVHIKQERREMLEQTPRRQAGKSKLGATYENGRSRMLLALVLLSLALVVVLVNDRQFWFGDVPTSVAEETTPEWVPGSVRPAPVAPAAPIAPAKATKHIAPAKSSAAPAIVNQPAVAATRTAIPPLEVEVVAGATHGTVHLGSNPEKVEMPLGSKFGSTATARGPATVAAERVTLAKATAGPEPAYPSLSRQMKVQGSVLLQAFISADGMIEDLRVLSGPAILASAAREAARQWQFKPYLQNGQPVETQAKITVNFTIKVLENGLRDQMDAMVALSRGGEN
jgi:periplasmic protein TonB